MSDFNALKFVADNAGLNIFKALEKAYEQGRSDALSTVKTAEAIPVKDLERIAQVLRNSREYELRVVGNAIPGIVSAWKEEQEGK